MNIIGIDTSTKFCSVGISGDGTPPVECNKVAGSKINERLFDQIAETLKGARVEKHSIDGVAICRGPGSFTGLRVGLSAAKGLAHSLNIPIIGVSAFEVLEYKLDSKYFPLCCVVPIKGEKISYVVFKSPGVTADEKAGTPGTWDDVIDNLEKINALCCIISEEVPEQLNLKIPAHAEFIQRKPSGIAVAEIGRHKLKNGYSDDLASLSPIYMHSIAFREKSLLKGMK